MTLPFDGLPLGWAVPLWIGLVVIVAMLAWTAILFMRGQRARLRAPAPPADGGAGLTWVFLVPGRTKVSSFQFSEVNKNLETAEPKGVPLPSL